MNAMSSYRLSLLAWIVALAGAGCSNSDSQPSNPQVLADAGADTNAEAGPGFDIDVKRIKADVAELSSAGYEGRLAGSAGGEKALQYVEALFTQLGLKPIGDSGYRQGFQFPQWAKTAPSQLDVAGATLVEGTDYVVMPYSGGGQATSPLLFAGFGLTIPAFDKAALPSCPYDAAGYDDYAGVDATGKIVIVFRHDATEDGALGDKCKPNGAAKSQSDIVTFGYKLANAKLHGAAAMVLVNDLSHEAAPIEGRINVDYFEAAFPVVSVDRDKLAVALPDLKTWVDAIKSTRKPSPQQSTVQATVVVHAAVQQAGTANLLGLVEGTDPALKSETVVIGAHVDHIGKEPASAVYYPGADDNASGTAVMMELARAVVLSGLHPKRSVLFASFNAEEEGLLGSCYYVSKPALPLATTTAMFSVDMVGAGDGSGLILYGATMPEFSWLADLMIQSEQTAGLSYSVDLQGPANASDDACFLQAGVPAMLALTRGPHGYYHTPEDTIDTIHEADLEAAARLLWVTLQPLAQGASKSP
jgi:aminopeptidase YwaD